MTRQWGLIALLAVVVVLLTGALLSAGLVVHDGRVDPARSTGRSVIVSHDSDADDQVESVPTNDHDDDD